MDLYEQPTDTATFFSMIRCSSASFIDFWHSGMFGGSSQYCMTICMKYGNKYGFEFVKLGYRNEDKLEPFQEHVSVLRCFTPKNVF